MIVRIFRNGLDKCAAACRIVFQDIARGMDIEISDNDKIRQEDDGQDGS